MIPRKAWREGLRFEASALDWRHGEGPLVRASAETLLLALASRAQVLDRVEGRGQDTSGAVYYDAEQAPIALRSGKESWERWDNFGTRRP